MRIRQLLPITIGLFLSGRSATAQPVAFAPTEVVARDTGATMQRLADGVYFIVHEAATPEWPHGNTGVIVGADGVLIIDSNYLPARAAHDIALIRRVTDRPVRWLINTHWHGDHTHGNGVYRDSFPGLTILGARDAAPFIEMNITRLPLAFLKPNSSPRRTLATLEAARDRGRDTAGRAFTEDEKKAMAIEIAQRQFELSELAKIKVAGPTQVFDNAMSLDMGRGRRAEIRNMGPANSNADVIVYLPAERILFAGDILVYPAPYTSGSFFMPWIPVLKSLEAYPVSAIVPGHGPALANHDYTRAVHDLFESIRRQTDSLYRLGVTAQDIVNRVDLKAMRNRFWVPAGRPVREAFWEQMTRAVVDKMSICVMGYSC